MAASSRTYTQLVYDTPVKVLGSLWMFVLWVGMVCGLGARADEVMWKAWMCDFVNPVWRCVGLMVLKLSGFDLC